MGFVFLDLAQVVLRILFTDAGVKRLHAEDLNFHSLRLDRAMFPLFAEPRGSKDFSESWLLLICANGCKKKRQ